MHDGVIREIKDVRFVPQLKKNLISPEALESMGQKVTIESGVLKVTKRYLVKTKGVGNKNLYFL